MEKGKFSQKKVKLDLLIPGDLQSHFVSNVIVQREPENFVLSFFETFPPIILGDTEEEQLAALAGVDRVLSKCVARLIVTPQKMGAFIKAMDENYKKFSGITSAEEKDE